MLPVSPRAPSQPSGRPGNIAVYLTQAGTLRSSVRGASETSNDFDALDVGPPPGIRDGLWHHYALVVDATGAAVFVDGAQAATAARGAWGLRLSDGLVFGNRQDLAPDRHFGGDLDAFAVFSRALNVSEIQGLAAAPR